MVSPRFNSVHLMATRTTNDSVSVLRFCLAVGGVVADLFIFYGSPLAHCWKRIRAGREEV